MDFKNKYLKYKNKYNILKNQLGGSIVIEKCIKINIILKNLLILTKQVPINYEEINKLFRVNNLLELLDDSITNNLIGSIIYLLSIDINRIENPDIKLIIESVYNNRLYNVPESDYTDFMSDEFLTQIGVWYKPYFKEEFWESDLRTFIDEYYKFKEERQSFLLYWTNLVNISMLFARINKCRFYVQTPDNNLFKSSDIIKENFTFCDRYGKAYLRKSNGEDFDKSNYNIIEIIKWNNIKDILVELLINSLDCKYDNIYLMYKKFLCFLYNNNNDELANLTEMPPYIKLICSQEECLFEGSKRRKFNRDKFKAESLDVETYERQFIYLSLILPSAIKFARHEFTNFVPAVMNPVKIADRTGMDIINLIGHDLKNHRVVERKKYFIDLPEIKDFVYIIHDEKKGYFLSYIHGLFYENRCDEPFSIASLNKRISEVSNDAAMFNNGELTLEIIAEFKDFFTKRGFLK